MIVISYWPVRAEGKLGTMAWTVKMLKTEVKLLMTALNEKARSVTV